MNKIIFKKYKLEKSKKQIKYNKIGFLFHATNSDSIKKLKLDQNLEKNNFKSIKIKNNLLKIVLKTSIFSKQCHLINGSLCFLYYSNPKIINGKFKNIFKVDPGLSLIAIKLNNKIYSINQLKKITTVNYVENLKIFSKTLNNIYKKPYQIL